MKNPKRERRQFTPEFKAQIVRLVIEEKRPIAQVAREHDVLRKSVHDWVAQARVDAGEGPSEKLTTSEREELVRLRKALKQAEMERDILKKATAFFAKQTT